MIVALEAKHWDNASALLDWGANPRIADRRGCDAWWWACKTMKSGSGFESTVAHTLLPKMIDMHPALTKCKIMDGYFNGGTALHAAARFGLDHTVAYLLSFGADGAARYQGGDDNGLTGCTIARRNGRLLTSKMLRVFTADDWKDWDEKGAGNLPSEAAWLRVAGKGALGRRVKVRGHGANHLWVEGMVDDFDPIRGMHHVTFNTNAAGSWEGWYLLDRSSGIQFLGRNENSCTKTAMKAVPVTPLPPPTIATTTAVGYAGFHHCPEASATALQQASRPAFQRSAVQDAFARQIASIGAI